MKDFKVIPASEIRRFPGQEDICKACGAHETTCGHFCRNGCMEFSPCYGILAVVDTDGIVYSIFEDNQNGAKS